MTAIPTIKGISYTAFLHEKMAQVVVVARTGGDRLKKTFFSLETAQKCFEDLRTLDGYGEARWRVVIHYANDFAQNGG